MLFTSLSHLLPDAVEEAAQGLDPMVPNIHPLDPAGWSSGARFGPRVTASTGPERRGRGEQEIRVELSRRGRGVGKELQIWGHGGKESGQEAFCALPLKWAKLE
ncbi:hypothetical protein E2562_016488 [Oryza meyeriana var. granulata]|uniref:Uncharacterized protein n=1 Tax=Oryza meyeriana var. granulata TaxID=110450 RepID=A0A6G1BLE7_9ORYZ|nr:hypothetical protein E2562_016488 [Oryza meyeriana var. granulata]